MWCCEAEYEAGSCNCESGQGTFSARKGKQVAVVTQGLVDGISSFSLSPLPTSYPSASLSVTSSSATKRSGRQQQTQSSTRSSFPSIRISANSTALQTSPSSRASSSTRKPSVPSPPLPTKSHISDSSIAHSTGFKVGIGVSCAVVGVVIVAALIWWFCWLPQRCRPEPGGKGVPLDSFLTGDHQPPAADTSSRNP